MSTVELLTAAKGLIANPENWTRGCAARNILGKPVTTLNSTAYSFCGVGAIDRATHELGLSYKAQNVAIKALHSLIKGSVSGFNDEHTHEEVMQLFDTAINNLKMKESST